MSESKHTAGPWAAEDAVATGKRVVSLSAPKTRRIVAACGGPDREANARLIAAAPDMLNLLRRAGEGSSPNADVATTWWEDRDAAIAKAEGRP